MNPNSPRPRLVAVFVVVTLIGLATPGCMISRAIRRANHDGVAAVKAGHPVYGATTEADVLEALGEPEQTGGDGYHVRYFYLADNTYYDFKKGWYVAHGSISALVEREARTQHVELDADVRADVRHR